MSTTGNQRHDGVVPPGGAADPPRLLIMLILVSGLSAIVVVQYRHTFANTADILSLQMLVQNPAIRVLFGVPLALDNAGGFTVWRTGSFAAPGLASWALLTATRITRGEKQSGRWALLLTGRHRLPSIVGHHLVVLLGCPAADRRRPGSGLIVAGAGVQRALIYALGYTRFTEADGSPHSILPASQVVRFLVRGYVLEDPSLARVMDESMADVLARTGQQAGPRPVANRASRGGC